MWLGFPLFPEQASTVASQVDGLFFYLVAVSLFFTVLIFTLVIFFAVKYRRRSEGERPRAVKADLRLEILWTAVPLFLVMVSFVWGASLYVAMNRPPDNGLEISVVAKQWMWKFQHPDGQREINELHVPAGQPVKLVMASEDVIHSFFVPAFRVKMDVVPGRTTTVWFEATKVGEYHLFCAEYCGTQHSGMIGRVYVMKPAQYQKWLSGGEGGEPMRVAGGRLFRELGCVTCHHPESGARGPDLRELFGKRVKLRSGETVVADEEYIRESILDPRAKIVAGYDPIMPTFKGLISEESLLQITAYIRSLGEEGRARAER